MVFPCPHCVRNFNSSEDLDTHVSRSHDGGKSITSAHPAEEIFNPNSWYHKPTQSQRASEGGSSLPSSTARNTHNANTSHQDAAVSRRGTPSTPHPPGLRRSARISAATASSASNRKSKSTDKRDHSPRRRRSVGKEEGDRRSNDRNKSKKGVNMGKDLQQKAKEAGEVLKKLMDDNRKMTEARRKADEERNRKESEERRRKESEERRRKESEERRLRKQGKDYHKGYYDLTR